MWGWDSICWAARKVDKTVREDAPAKLKQYTPDQKLLQDVFRYCTGSLSGIYSAERMREIQKMARGNWDSVCSVTGKIDKTVREDAPSKFLEYAPDLRVFCATVGKNALEEIMVDSGVPGVRLFYRSWKESMRKSQSGGPSQMHGQGKENGERRSTHERERAEREERLLLLLAAQTKRSQTQAILKTVAPTEMNNQPFSADGVIKVLKQIQMTDSSDQSSHVESEDK